jgi:hypothetical protein
LNQIFAGGSRQSTAFPNAKRAKPNVLFHADADLSLQLQLLVAKLQSFRKMLEF